MDVLLVAVFRLFVAVEDRLAMVNRRCYPAVVSDGLLEHDVE